MVIKLNKYNKAYTPEGNEVTNFDTDIVSNFQFRLSDGSLLEIPIEKCVKLTGGYYKTEYDGEEYIFDDGNRYESVLLGYLVYHNYDTESISDREEGLELRNRLYDEIVNKYRIYTNTKEIVKDDLDFVLCIDKIGSIVTKNQNRKEEGKKVFPYIKSMDKYGTFYVSIFSNSRDEIKTKLCSSSIIHDMIDILGPDDWKFVSKEYSRIPLYI